MFAARVCRIIVIIGSSFVLLKVIIHNGTKVSRATSFVSSMDAKKVTMMKTRERVLVLVHLFKRLNAILSIIFRFSKAPTISIKLKSNTITLKFIYDTFGVINIEVIAASSSDSENILSFSNVFNMVFIITSKYIPKYYNTN